MDDRGRMRSSNRLASAARLIFFVVLSVSLLPFAASIFSLRGASNLASRIGSLAEEEDEPGTGHKPAPLTVVSAPHPAARRLAPHRLVPSVGSRAGQGADGVRPRFVATSQLLDACGATRLRN